MVYKCIRLNLQDKGKYTLFLVVIFDVQTFYPFNKGKFTFILNKIVCTSKKTNTVKNRRCINFHL